MQASSASAAGTPIPESGARQKNYVANFNAIAPVAQEVGQLFHPPLGKNTIRRYAEELLNALTLHQIILFNLWTDLGACLAFYDAVDRPKELAFLRLAGLLATHKFYAEASQSERAELPSLLPFFEEIIQHAGPLLDPQKVEELRKRLSA